MMAMPAAAAPMPMPACAPVDRVLLLLLLVLLGLVSAAAAALPLDELAVEVVDAGDVVVCEFGIALAVCTVIFGLDEEEDGLTAGFALAVFSAVSAGFALKDTCR